LAPCGRLQPNSQVARALIARVKATDPSIKRLPRQSPLRAAGVRRSRMSGRRAWRRANRLRSGDGQEHVNISRSKQVTDWVGSLGLRSSSKLLQRSPAAACSCSQLESRRMCQTFAPPIHCPENTGLPLSGSPPTRAGRPRLGWGERSSRG
jgi:hypothetical protein